MLSFFIRPAVWFKGKGVSMLSVQACWSLPHPNWTNEENQAQLTKQFTQGPASNSANTECLEFIFGISQLAQHWQSPSTTSQSTQQAPAAVCSTNTFPRGWNTLFGYQKNQNTLNTNKKPTTAKSLWRTLQNYKKLLCLKDVWELRGPI